MDAEPPSHPSPPNTHAHTPPVPSTIFPLAPPPPSLARSLAHPSLASWLLKGTQDPDRHPPSPKYSRTAQPDPSPLLPTAAHLSTSASSLSSPYLFPYRSFCFPAQRGLLVSQQLPPCVSFPLPPFERTFEAAIPACIPFPPVVDWLQLYYESAGCACLLDPSRHPPPSDPWSRVPPCCHHRSSGF